MTDTSAPPQFLRKHLKLIIILAAVLIPIGAFLLYRHVLSNSVETRLAAIRAQGLPTDWDELNDWYPEPPGANAASIYQEAFLQYNNTDANTKGIPVLDKEPLPAAGTPMAAEIKQKIVAYLHDNQNALTLLHKAADVKECRYPIDLRQGPSTLLQHLAPLRQAARLLKLEAVVCAEEGRADDAAASVTASLATANSLSKEPVLISQLVRMTCISITCSSLEYALNRTTFTDERLSQLSEAFHATENPESIIRAFVSERANNLAFYDQPALFAGATGSAGRTVALHVGLNAAGLLDLDRKYFLDIMEGQLAALRRPVEERVKASAAFDMERRIKELPKYCIITHVTIGALGRVVVDDSKCFARLRTAYAALAVERYRLANGNLPEKLDDLAPKYFTRIPLDPFDGLPLHFKKLKKGYVVYSIGDNLVDDGGIAPSPNPDPRKSSPPLDITFTVER